MIHFTFEEKLAIGSACLAFVLFLAIIMACKLSPWCILYKFCPFRATYDDNEEKIIVKAHPIPDDLKTRYKLIDYKNLLPTIPSIKVTKIDETCGHASTSNKPNTSVSLTLINDENEIHDPTMLLSRPQRQSISSISDSSTASSEHDHTQRGRPKTRSRANSGPFSSDCDDSTSTPNLELGLQYDEPKGTLRLFVHKAHKIPPDFFGTPNDSYVQIIVGKDTGKYWRRKSDVPVDQFVRSRSVSPCRNKSLTVDDDRIPANSGYSKLAEFETRVVKKDSEPMFNEHFVIDDVNGKEKKNVWIKFILHSIDRQSHEYTVGTKQIGLARASGIQSDLINDRFNISLEKYTPNLGEMTLSLCYMPTAARLVVTILKIANLKPPDGLVTANPYVKGAILRRGRVLEKHVTSPQIRVINPTFSDEPLVFDVPTNELEKIILLLHVVHDNVINEPEPSLLTVTDIGMSRRRSVGNFLHMAQSLEASSQLHKSRSNSCLPTSTETECSVQLGRVAFGSSVVDNETIKRHWAEMMSNPRVHITRTHKLRP